MSQGTPEDTGWVLDLIELGEGKPARELAARWTLDQPGGLYVVRSDSGLVGFSTQVYLPSDGDIGRDDPFAVEVMRVVAERGPLRPGERVNINRFQGASSAYQRDPFMLLVGGVSCILEWAHQPAAWSFITTIDPEFYGA